MAVTPISSAHQKTICTKPLEAIVLCHGIGARGVAIGSKMKLLAKEAPIRAIEHGGNVLLIATDNFMSER